MRWITYLLLTSWQNDDPLLFLLLSLQIRALDNVLDQVFLLLDVFFEVTHRCLHQILLLILKLLIKLLKHEFLILLLEQGREILIVKLLGLSKVMRLLTEHKILVAAALVFACCDGGFEQITLLRCFKGGLLHCLVLRIEASLVVPALTSW